MTIADLQPGDRFIFPKGYRRDVYRILEKKSGGGAVFTEHYAPDPAYIGHKFWGDPTRGVERI